MSDNHNTDETTQNDPPNVSVNRRSVLKKLGTAGIVGALGVPATVSADTTPSDAHVEEILETPRVTRIREKIGSFTVEDATVKRIQHEEKTLTQTTIETDLGTLIDTDIGSAVEASFELALSNNPTLHQALPESFDPVPAESTVSLLSDESSSTFVRPATDDELAQLEQAIDDTVIAAVYASNISGFAVTAGTVNEENTEIQRYQVGASGEDISAAAVEQVLAPQGCIASCTGCAAAVVSKGLCYSSCVAAISGVGIAVCLACVFSSNVGILTSCSQCASCF